MGFEGADFINLVVGFRTADSPAQVKQALEKIEALCGRPHSAPKWAPRTMDLDILMYDQVVSDEPGLFLPRPDLLRRAFMLKPLADLAPRLRHPTQQRTIGELWAEFPAAGSSARRSHHPTLRPPSTARICPVTYGASFTKNKAARTTSSGDPLRFSSVFATISFCSCGPCRPRATGSAPAQCR